MAASRLAIATPPPAYVLSRGIGWQVRLYLLFIYAFMSERLVYLEVHNLIRNLFGSGHRYTSGWFIWNRNWIHGVGVRI